MSESLPNDTVMLYRRCLALALVLGPLAIALCGCAGHDSVEDQQRNGSSAMTTPASKVTFALDKAFGADNTHWGNRALVSFLLVDGKPYAPKVAHANNTTYADFTYRVDSIQWQAGAGGAFTCHIRGHSRPAGSKYRGGAIDFVMEGRQTDGRIEGTFTALQDNAQIADGPLAGTIEPCSLPDPANSRYELHMHGAAPDGKAVWVHLDCTDGAFVAGLAYVPQFNHAVHLVDASKLKLIDGRIRGSLAITILPDPYIPKDRQPIACTYDIDAAVRNGGLEGSFTGAFGQTKVDGKLAGLTDHHLAVTADLNVRLKMEEALAGGPPWHNRAFVTFQITNGKAHEGKITANKGGWTGAVTSLHIALEERRLRGRLTVDITSDTVKPGGYTIEFDGRLIGTQLLGDYVSRHGGKIVQRGKFMGVARQRQP